MALKTHRVAVLAITVLLLCCGATIVRSDDRSQVHSLVPPILKDYWMSGMEYWSFGRDTVVTDQYVQLTDLEMGAKGYLWNKHESETGDFELNVTVQMGTREGYWFASGVDSGFGVWYTNTEKFGFKSDASYYGFQKTFMGIGMVLDHNNELSLLQSDGESEMTTAEMRESRHGYCSLPSFGGLHVTLSLKYTSQDVEVYFTLHHGQEPQPEDYDNAVLCCRARGVDLSMSYHFGVTAANGKTAQAIHNVHSVIMSPLSNLGKHAIENDLAGQPRLFDDDAAPTQGSQ